MKYNLTVKITDGRNSKTLYLLAEFGKSNSGYGNDMYLAITGREYRGIKTTFENVYDIRYDTSFNRKKPELYLAGWVYKYWTGENGSWKVQKLAIENLNPVSVKPQKAKLKADVTLI